jgi:cell wall-associated NlpC family hydrolase
VSWEQIKVGQPVANLADAKPGDLLFFHEPSGHRHDPGPLGVNHVGMYLGNGKMVEAANPSAGTRISTVDQSHLVGVRRLAG